MPIARQRLGKHIFAEANARNNRAFITRKRISKHPSLTIEEVFSVECVQSGYKEVFGNIKSSWVVSNFETIACRDMSLGEAELNWVGSCRTMSWKELGGANKTSCVIWSDSETIMNPFPGYD
jgi:hypothetical protein